MYKKRPSRKSLAAFCNFASRNCNQTNFLKSRLFSRPRIKPVYTRFKWRWKKTTFLSKNVVLKKLTSTQSGLSALSTTGITYTSAFWPQNGSTARWYLWRLASRVSKTQMSQAFFTFVKKWVTSMGLCTEGRWVSNRALKFRLPQWICAYRFIKSHFMRFYGERFRL